jgi:ABC-type lipoprotein release transport system permease subunit
MELESPVTGKWNKQEGVLLYFEGRSFTGKDWDEAYMKMQKAIKAEKRRAIAAMVLILICSILMVLI